jgi:DNA-binding NarL/FixJ family response regulator
MAPLRIFLADDHEIVRFGLRTLLEIQDEWMIVGEAGDGAAAIEGVMSCEPDIAILDIGMPVMDGLTVAKKLVASGSTAKILILSLHDSKNVIRQVVDSGAKGFVLKSDAARDLIAAVEAIQAGGTFFTPKTAEIILDRQLDRMQERRVRPTQSSSKKRPVRHN